MNSIIPYTKEPNKNVTVFTISFDVYNYSISTFYYLPTLFFQRCNAFFSSTFKPPLEATTNEVDLYRRTKTDNAPFFIETLAYSR